MIDNNKKLTITELNTIIFHVTMGRNNTKSFLRRMESTGDRNSDYLRLENELKGMEALIEKLTGIRDEHSRDMQVTL